MLTVRIIFITAFGLFFVSAKAQEDFRKIFGEDYQKAIWFLNEEKWIEDSIRNHRINPKEGIAIIFPELIRYNSIQDKIETFALESLYIKYGKDYANFSINQFQIKPSFAETLEIDFLKINTQTSNIQPSDTIQNQENRAKRLKRIKSKSGMVNYLCMFFAIMNQKYSDWKNDEEKIKFFATAYNCGYRKSKEEIVAFESKEFFYTGLPLSQKKYCYTDIALYFFRNR